MMVDIGLIKCLVVWRSIPSMWHLGLEEILVSRSHKTAPDDGNFLKVVEEVQRYSLFLMGQGLGFQRSPNFLSLLFEMLVSRSQRKAPEDDKLPSGCGRIVEILLVTKSQKTDGTRVRILGNA